MSYIGYASLSGLQAAELGMKTVSHNISNSETPGYHRVEAIMQEMGPFPTIAGVDADVRRTENELLDNMMQTAVLNKQLSDTLQGIVGKLDTLPFETLSKTYSEMMDSTHQLLRTPDDPIAQQHFNDKVVGFQNSLNRYQEQLDSIKKELGLRLESEDERLIFLRQQLQDAVRSGVATRDELDAIKLQIMQTTGSVDAYRKVLSDIVPPVELAYTDARDIVYDSVNQLSGQTVFNKDGTTNTIADFTNFKEENLPEWDSHWFNTEMGRIQTSIGNKQQIIDNDAAMANRIYDDTSAQFEKEFGVDIVEEQVKMMRYQRMYESCAAVIKAQDSLIGVAINMVAR